MDGPVTRRETAMKLTQFTKGRCLIVQHRLAPQNAFPAQHLDVLIAYLSLLYPPPGAYHLPVPASHIVLAGDSSGTQLVVSLIQIILSTQKRQASSHPILRFQGRMVELPMPAGFVMQSPSFDHMGNCLPTYHTNEAYDIFPNTWPCYEPNFPADEAWPTDPPRGNLYCELNMLGHPLVSPIATKSWKGAPPMYIAIGSAERNLDAARVVAQTAAKEGVVVLWDEYELMPHNWPMLCKSYPQASKCYETWAGMCSKLGQGIVMKSTGTLTSWGDLKITTVDVSQLTPLTREEVERLVESKLDGGHVLKSTL